jgi:hypothetical protein
MRRLIDDWRRVLRRAWSVRLAVLSAVLSAAEVTMQLLAPQMSGGGFAVAAGLVALAAAIARLVAQPAMRQEDRP